MPRRNLSKPYAPFGILKKEWPSRKEYLDEMDAFIASYIKRHSKAPVNKAILRWLSLGLGPAFTRMIDNTPGGPKIYHEEVSAYVFRHPENVRRVHIGSHRILYKTRTFPVIRAKVKGRPKPARPLIQFPRRKRAA